MDAKLQTDLLRVYSLALVSSGRGVRDDKSFRDMRQAGSQVVSDAVGQIFLAWVAAEILERQDDN